MIKQYLNNRGTIILLVITAFFWTFLIAGLINRESVLESLDRSLQVDGWFSFLFAGFGCLMVPAMSIAIPIYLIVQYRKLK